MDERLVGSWRLLSLRMEMEVPVRSPSHGVTEDERLLRDVKIADENRMIERRDACGSDSHQDFSVCNLWFWNLYQLQRFITTKLLRSHCAHSESPFALVTPDLRR